MTIDRSREGPNAYRRRTPVLAATVVALALAAAGCGSGGSSSSSSGSSGTPSGGGGTAALSVKGEGKLGRILVDAQGRTLYLFQKDRGPRSTCYGACMSVWPPVTSSAKPTARGGASMSKLTTTRRTDGTAQLVYDGHPLYYYAPDNGRPGSTKGEALKQFGAEWYVAAEDGARTAFQAQAIVAALRTLRAEHRHAIVEVHFRGRSVREAAARLGVPPGTVKSRCYYGLRALRRELERKGLLP